MRGKFFHLWNAQWLLCKLANRAQTASLGMSPAAEQPAGFALSNRCEVASISRFLSTKQCVVLIDMIMSSAQFFGDTGCLLHSNWPQEVEVSLFLGSEKAPASAAAPLHWLQPHRSTLHQPQPSEGSGAVASTYFLGLFSVTPPFCSFIAPSLGSGCWWAFYYHETLI